MMPIKNIIPLLIISFSVVQLMAQNRPNIMVIIADDIGADAFAAYGIGTNLPSTPNLDALLNQGILFTNAWSYPTCAPSRAALLTGRYGNKNGVLRSGLNLATSEVTLFEHIDALTNGAYAHAVFGKWHLGGVNHPNDQGVDHYAGGISSGVADYFNWDRTENGITNVSTDYVTTQITDEAIDWVDAQTQPWLLWMAHNAPHSPFHIPPDSLYTHGQTNNNFNQFLCMIESVDHEVGRLYNSLTQQEKDSTLIIFVGDNGTPNNILRQYPSGHGKGTLYEGGIRVPMFVTGYGVNRIQEEEDALVSFADLFATLTELLGTDLPGGMDNSFSFYPLLSDAQAESRPYNYSELNDTATELAIRDAQYKLIKFADGSQEFYDLLNDPLETSDLVPGGLSNNQMAILQELSDEADTLFSSWSCQDAIQNGNETGIDCGGSFCQPCMPTALEDEVQAPKINIYPNPGRGHFYVQSEGSPILEIRVVNMLGELLLSQKPTDPMSAQLDLGHISPQVLLFKVKTAKSWQSLLVIKH